jgi:glycosyltransferase involved in cell wall biosynthesis
LEAWKKARLKDAELRLVGRMSLTPDFLADYQGLYQHLPSMPRERLRAEYQAADVLVFPTLGDGFGMVIQEAMCSGVPVLTTRCGGGPECITHGEDGWIVEEANVDALVAALRNVSDNRDALLQMGGAARKRAERWTWVDAGEEVERQIRMHVGSGS